MRGLERKAILERRFGAAEYCVDARRERERCIREHLSEQSVRGREQLASAHHSVHETDAQCFGRVDDLAGHEQLERTPGPNKPGETLRPAVARADAQLDLRLAELRGVACDAKVTCHRELASTAQRETVDRGDDRLGRGFELSEDVLPPERSLPRFERTLIGELVDVGASDECPSRSGEDRTADVITAAYLIDRVAQLADGRGIQRVQFVRAIDRECGDPIDDGEIDEGVRHREAVCVEVWRREEPNAGIQNVRSWT